MAEDLEPVSLSSRAHVNDDSVHDSVATDTQCLQRNFVADGSSHVPVDCTEDSDDRSTLSQPNADVVKCGNECDNEMADSVLDDVDDNLPAFDDKSTEQERDGWMFILGHDQLKKRVLKPGKESSRPQRGQLVTIRCVGRLDDGTEVDRHDSLQLCVGEDDFIPAFDLSITLMDVGEICEVFTAARFAYGSIGRKPEIPSNAAITYEVELIQVDDRPEFHTMTVSYRVKLSNEKRERGNVLYSRGEFSRAIDAYSKAQKIVNDDDEPHTETVDELKLMSDTRVKCYNNLAAAQMKIEAWDAAIQSCDAVLRVEPENVKALFRKAKCLMSKGEYDDAAVILRTVSKLEPDSKMILQELITVERKIREQNISQKQLYQKMLGTDKQPFLPKTPSIKQSMSRDRQWLWYVIGAMAAMTVPVCLTVYRQFSV